MRGVALPQASSWSMVTTRLLTHNVKLRKSAENIKLWLNCCPHCPKLKLGNGHLQKSQETQNINLCCCKDRPQSLSYFVPKAGSTCVASLRAPVFCETYQIKKSKENASPRSLQKKSKSLRKRYLQSLVPSTKQP